MKHIKELGESLQREDRAAAEKIIARIKEENHELSEDTEKVLNDILRYLDKNDFSKAFNESFTKYEF
ncbi:hypothetical protein [Ligilactobacillus ceti]|uniref:Uncharacterized protein n=1 Tax=Ligilactobacillus ceti DSM 22408 TaxID=1122146 RepID=A0A0R2KRQ7_9LACO|nr:hypothetical protein [Ligilactobacillus ceti]KRN89242.1 hypothetical protein IV53_GL000155 [Ligilactobacillus ceti DSM 22408]